LYLIRHGQAGSRQEYDRLSDTGRRQAVLLGKTLQEIGVTFSAFWSGSMVRQHETARAVLGTMGSSTPLIVDERWNEFSLEGLWAGLAPRMLAADPVFARLYAQEHRDNPAAERRTTACDVHLIRAWFGGEAVEGVESWETFRARVGAAHRSVEACGAAGDVAVFTSATPAGLCCAATLGIDGEQIFRMAAALYNASYSVLRLRRSGWFLESFNNAGHLAPARLLTER
jgi:broad specificity phosphatase PhoE